MVPPNRPAGADVLADDIIGTISGGIARRWWILAVRGALAILFGILAIGWPQITLLALTWLWGAFVLVDGILAFTVGVQTRWWPMIVLGVLGVVAGLIAIFVPAAVIAALLAVIAAWIIVRGFFEVIAAIYLRKEIENEWWLIAGGLLSIVYGVVLLAYPREGVIAWLWLIAAGAIVVAIFLLILAFRLKKIGDRMRPRPGY